MPVLYVAVGRRLGYPLKLVRAKSHMFVRWDAGDGKNFNVEATSRGFSVREDAYYKTWPRPMSEEEFTGGEYMKTMTPVEELACFMSTRGVCLQVNGRFAEATAAYQQAAKLVPASKLYARFAAQNFSQQNKTDNPP